MKIAVTGSTGLIGSYLCSHFENQNQSVCCLRRRPFSRASFGEEVLWDPKAAKLDAQALQGVDAVIHLAGANLADKRWNAGYKKEILESRVEGTRLLVDTFRKMITPPKAFICASAVGFYGHRTMEERCDESAGPGDTFLAGVCQAWEGEALKAAELLGTRTVIVRLGAVLSPKGGILARLLPVFRFGLGGAMGNGRQPFSWIAICEIPRILDHILAHEELKGPVNCSSPQVVSNREFTAILAKFLHRPALLPVPAAVLRLIAGEMADEVILQGAYALPARLLDTGYVFRHADLGLALAAVSNPENNF